MQAYATAEADRKAREPAPPPVVFTEVLPAAPGQKPGAIRWTPGRKAGTGLLRILAPTGRCSCVYVVRESRTAWDGRAAHFEKAPGEVGSDDEAAEYDVFVGRTGQDRRCDCKGFGRWGHCKHAAALAALLANGWLDLHLANPEADVGPTEPPADQPEPDLPEIPEPQGDEDGDEYLSDGDAEACDEYLFGPREDRPPLDWTDVPY